MKNQLAIFTAFFTASLAFAMGGSRPGCALAPHQAEFAAIVKARVPRGSNGRASAASILRTDSKGNIIEVGFEKNAGVFQAVASTQKIMTAWVTIKKGGKLSQLVRFTSDDLFYDVQGYRAVHRKTGKTIEVGEQVSIADYLYTLFTQSSNGAAQALSRGPTDTTEAFVRLMNQEARTLLGSGAVSYFQNPSGLTDDAREYRFADTNRTQGSTTREMAALVGKMMSDSKFRSMLANAGVASASQGGLYKLGETEAAGQTMVARFRNPAQGCSSEGIAMAFFGAQSSTQFQNFKNAYLEIYSALSK